MSCQCKLIEEAVLEMLRKMIVDGRINGFGAVKVECADCADKRTA